MEKNLEKLAVRLKEESFKAYKLPPDITDKFLNLTPIAFPFAKALIKSLVPDATEEFISEQLTFFYLGRIPNIELNENEFFARDNSFADTRKGTVIRYDPNRLPIVGYAVVEFADELFVAFISPKSDNMVKLIFNDEHEALLLPEELLTVKGTPVSYRLPGETEYNPIKTLV
ncbi:MAG: hypothetical protein IJA87_11615 [Clostridia bacterium]|nr:hypothetical protein [Clostridia bacterium]